MRQPAQGTCRKTTPLTDSWWRSAIPPLTSPVRYMRISVPSAVTRRDVSGWIRGGVTRQEREPPRSIGGNVLGLWKD